MKAVVVLSLVVAVVCLFARVESTFQDVTHVLPPTLPSWIVNKIRSAAGNFPLDDSRIVGGEEVVPHSEPHQVALNITLGGRQAFCGGSLISDSWVITAAHCADLASKIVVVLGAHNIKKDEPSTRSVPVSDIVVHPEWNLQWIRNDIALLKLEQPITLDGTYVNTIRLPRISQKNKSFWRSTVTMTGWGKDSDKASTISPVLRSVSSKVVSNLYCSFRYMFAVVQGSNICASGWRAKGTCNGDSGGPMYTVESDGHKTLIGITSFGLSLGCEWSWPPVFTRVSSYLDWIHKTTNIQERP